MYVHIQNCLKFIPAGILTALLAAPVALAAETHTVTAQATAYDPMVLQIEPGDTVEWVNMSGHFNEFEAGNIPEDAEPWKTQMGEDVSRTFDVEGVYVYKCPPHFAMGMVGAIIVGEPHNMAEVEENATGMYKRAVAKAKAESN